MLGCQVLVKDTEGNLSSKTEYLEGKTMKESKTTKFSKFPETIYPPYSQKPWCNPYKSAEWKEKVTKQLQKQIEKAEIQMKSWQQGSPEWFRTAYQHGYFVLKEILEALK